MATGSPSAVTVVLPPLVIILIMPLLLFFFIVMMIISAPQDGAVVHSDFRALKNLLLSGGHSMDTNRPSFARIVDASRCDLSRC